MLKGIKDWLASGSSIEQSTPSTDTSNSLMQRFPSVGRLGKGGMAVFHDLDGGAEPH